jgi:hypothetical protein
MQLKLLLLAVGLLTGGILPALSQGGPDLSVTLGAQDGRTTFRIGEPIALELRYTTKTEGQYQVHPTAFRQLYYSPIRAIVEPDANAVDPIADYPRELGFRGPGAGGVVVPSAIPLGLQPVVIRMRLNEWLSIRKPGRYRITVETQCVNRKDQPAKPVQLRSNTIELDVVAPELGWAETQIQRAIQTRSLSSRIDAPPDPNPPLGAPGPSTLRFLETGEAALALVHFLPTTQDIELEVGLWQSPHRKTIIDAMQVDLQDPDVPIRFWWLRILAELAAASAVGPRLVNDSADHRWEWDDAIWRCADCGSPPPNPRGEWGHRFQESVQRFRKQYCSQLAAAVDRKRGVAQAASFQTWMSECQY